MARYTTKCPRCGRTGEITTEQLSPTVSCGECLMEHVEVVHLALTPIELSPWRVLKDDPPGPEHT